MFYMHKLISEKVLVAACLISINMMNQVRFLLILYIASLTWNCKLSIRIINWMILMIYNMINTFYMHTHNTIFLDTSGEFKADI